MLPADRPGSLSPTIAQPDASDLELVKAAVAGSRASLELLIRRHQSWVYNIAVRMVWDRHDAQDVTQEILIKIITGLSTFRGDSAFRTWVYRITVNHVLTMRRRKMESPQLTFTSLGDMTDRLPDLPLPQANTVPVDLRLLVHETKVTCTLGMLLCLDRRQRLVFTLGEVMGVSDTVGAELMQITPDHFRQLLARARKDLYNFMSSKCGLVDARNPCRCARKTKALIDAGHVDPASLRFVPERVEEIRTRSDTGSAGLDAAMEKGAKVFQQLAVLPAPDQVHLLRNLLSSGRFRKAMDLGNQ